MTKPSDYSPAQALQVSDGDRTRMLNRRIWALRITGVILLVSAWFAISFDDFHSVHFVISTAIFGFLAAYAFVAAALGRRVAVNLEKKLRLHLLVHNMELENMAMRDDLTQLFNRRYLFDRLERELQIAKGFQRPLGFITLDLDSLKAVNDTYGHRMGDKALSNFGRLLLSHTRATDVPARIGGDEFAIILPDASKRGVSTMMERLTKALDETNLIDEDGLTLRLGASLGMSGYPWAGDTLDAIVQEADSAMYTEKQARKNNGSAAAGDSGAADINAVPSVFRRTDDAAGEGASDLEVPSP